MGVKKEPRIVKNLRGLVCYAHFTFFTSQPVSPLSKGKTVSSTFAPRLFTERIFCIQSGGGIRTEQRACAPGEINATDKGGKQTTKKRILASALALCMVFSMTVTASAAEENVTLPAEEITVQTENEAPVPAEVPAEESSVPEETPVEEVPDEEIPVEEVPAEEVPTEPEVEVLPEEPLDVSELAETDTVPEVTNMNISYNGTTIERDLVSGSFVFTADGDTEVADYTATITLSDDAVFTPTTPGVGDLYVASVVENTATLKFHVEEEDEFMDNYTQFDLNLTKSSGNTWTGSFTNAANLKLDMLAGYLSSKSVHLADGALGANSQEQDILVNEDEVNVMLILCAPDAVINTVSYEVAGDTITWNLPQGMNMPMPEYVLPEGQEVVWYTDATHQEEYTGGTVNQDTILYGVIEGGSTTENDVLYALEHNQPVYIYDLEDFEVFVANSSKAVSGQVVTLMNNIDCQNASYSSMTFAGDFNGNEKSISNATFESVSNTPSGEACSGMFATLGHGQIVANLTLYNVEAEYAGEYAGALVGMADGWSNDRVLIQNVQVRDSRVSGRSAGGIAGFIRNTDVMYCSSRNTTISGLANGGGVVGLNNAHVEFCYSTTTPTALTILGGSAGGVIGKNVRGGNNDYCWGTMKVVGYEDDGPGPNLNSFIASEDTWSDDFEDAGFTQECWNLADGTATDFDYTEIKYTFPANPANS